jgi:hypothetical protein
MESVAEIVLKDLRSDRERIFLFSLRHIFVKPSAVWATNPKILQGRV